MHFLPHIFWQLENYCGSSNLKVGCGEGRERFRVGRHRNRRQKKVYTVLHNRRLWFACLDTVLIASRFEVHSTWAQLYVVLQAYVLRNSWRQFLTCEYVFWGLFLPVKEEFLLLRRYAALLGSYLATFRYSLSVQFSKGKQSKNMSRKRKINISYNNFSYYCLYYCQRPVHTDRTTYLLNFYVLGLSCTLQ
jgi:hypothetical protein